MLDPTVMSHHTSVNNCFYFVITIALSVITDCLICTEFLCIFNLKQQHSFVKDVGFQTVRHHSSGRIHFCVSYSI